jgi:protein-disulfide isomerase
MTKEMSKRQQRREKLHRTEQRRRSLTIGLVTIGAILIAFIFIYPNLKPIGGIVTVEPNPRPQADGTAMGDPNAPIQIDLFEDFQCPACSTYSQQTESLITDNYVATGKVYYVFHHFPFIDTYSAGKESQQAANASMCAAEQDMFWEYHDILFANWNGENQGAFADRRLEGFAQSIGLDMQAFSACFDENRYREEIQADFELGGEMGVQGTPSLFINGQFFDPGHVPQYSEIQQELEKILSGN